MHLKRMRKERDEEKIATDNYCFIKLIAVGELCVNNGDIMGIQLFIWRHSLCAISITPDFNQIFLYAGTLFIHEH